ncbi:hypothetical protein [Streptomyces sp. G1]|uniref:hypothetical protein n=1 Tax=Streptomyces sp. G1 TaxID=361572 RepID=UPI0020307B0B|nr:hypothetical protein [Streptomyces sp. G1]MCM1977180.1 hypothetical protein [Streptomyces sp. G1]
MNDADVPRPATSQLLALAAACRPDWSPGQLSDVLAQARPSMTWGRCLVAVAQLIADPTAEPPDLLAEIPESWRQRRRPQGPETAHRGAAAVRAALHHPESDCS